LKSIDFTDLQCAKIRLLPVRCIADRPFTSESAVIALFLPVDGPPGRLFFA